MKTTRSAGIAAIIALSAAGFAQIIDTSRNIDNGFAIPRRSSSSSRSRQTPSSSNATANSANANTSRGSNVRAPSSGSGSSARATPTPSRSSGSSGYTRTTSSSSRSTTGSASRSGSTASASRPKSGSPGAGATGATWTGQVKEVSKGFVEAMKTQRVQFDEESMSEQPGIIILNSRKYQPDPDDTSKSSKTPDSLISRPL